MANDPQQKPQAAPGEAPKTTQEVIQVTIEDLAHAKEKMDNVMEGLFSSRSAEIQGFMKEYDAKEYHKGDWKQWNEALLTALGIPLQSEDITQGIVRRIEDYLNRSGSPEALVVEGKFGPKALQALEGYMAANYPTGAPVAGAENPFWQTQKEDMEPLGPEEEAGEKKAEEKPAEQKEEWKEEDIAASYPNGVPNEYYYRTKDGRWIDRSGKALDLKVALPKMGKEVAGYFKVENTGGVTEYIDKTGKVHTGIDPTAKAPDWAEEKAA